MQRFRLLGFYVAGVVVIVGLAIWGVSLRPFAADSAPANASALQALPPVATATTTSMTKVSIDNFAFRPRELVVPPGTTVTWVNSDDVPHTVTSSASPRFFDSKALDTDDQFSLEFKTPGTYDYFCKPHPHMTGKIIVK